MVIDITEDEFESATDDAFSYLVSDFGYPACSPKRGDRFGLALARRFATQQVGRPIGIFSSLELAERAIKNRHKATQHLKRVDGYEIWRMDIDPPVHLRPADLGLSKD